MSIENTYNSNLLKGTGLIQETILLLESYEPGMPRSSLIEKVLREDLLSKATETRVKDIVNQVFYRRYVYKNEKVAYWLKYLRGNMLSIDNLTQLFLIYTCRENKILGDFIIYFYYSQINKGVKEIKTEDPKIFIKEAIKDGRINQLWSASTIRKVSEHIIATLIDFKLIDKSKTILQFNLYDTVANFLAHELHFNGVPDQQITDSYDWRLFGLSTYDVIKILERISLKGHFIFQSSGEIVRITWSYKNMEELINGLT